MSISMEGSARSEPNQPGDLIYFGPDALYFGIEFQRRVPMLASIAALLVSAKRGRSIKDIVTVNPDRSCFEHPREPMRFANVACPDASSQAIGAVIRAPGDVFQIIKRQHDHYRAKNLFTSDGH